MYESKMWQTSHLWIRCYFLGESVVRGEVEIPLVLERDLNSDFKRRHIFSERMAM